MKVESCVLLLVTMRQPADTASYFSKAFYSSATNTPSLSDLCEPVQLGPSERLTYTIAHRTCKLTIFQENRDSLNMEDVSLDCQWLESRRRRREGDPHWEEQGSHGVEASGSEVPSTKRPRLAPTDDKNAESSTLLLEIVDCPLYHSRDRELPDPLTLYQLCQQYPNSLVTVVLNAFIQQMW